MSDEDTVKIVGVGVHPFGRFTDGYRRLGAVATQRALADAGLQWSDIDAAFCASMYLPATSGLRILGAIGRTGIPVTDVEAACASGAVALRQGVAAIRSGTARHVLVLGVEKMPRGFLDPTMIYDPWQIEMGLAINPAYWAMRARRHMVDHGTTEEQIAAVAVKNHLNSVHNPMAMYRKAFSLEEVLGSKLVCDPVRILEICAPNDGAAAVVLSADTTQDNAGRAVVLEACVHTTARFSADFRSPTESMSVSADHPGPTVEAARRAYEIAGLGPDEIDCFEVQDTDAFCEIEAYEDLGMCPVGDGGGLVSDGSTELTGSMPVNMSGGLISKGEPVGASHLGQLAEIVMQVRHEAGPRQVDEARTGLAHVLGAGGNCAVTIVRRDRPRPV